MTELTQPPLGTESEPGAILNNARSRCAEAISDAFNSPQPVLVDALPAMGKSSGIIRWATQTEQKLTVLTARRSLYDEYTQWCEEHGLTSHTLPSFHYDCSTANGEHGSEWTAKVTDKYQSGLRSGLQIHEEAVSLFGEELPCQQERECPYLTSHSFDPSEYDVLIGHYKHSNVQDRIEGRYVVFDEFPEGDFWTTYSSSEANQAIGDYVGEQDGIPFQYPKEILTCRSRSRRQQAIDWFHERNPQLTVSLDVDREEAIQKVHIDAARLTYVRLTARDLGNGWEHAALPDGHIAAVDPRGDMTILRPPSLEKATSVVALDGTPTVEMWRLLLGQDLEHRQVLTDAERRQYLRHGLKLRIIQTIDEVKPYNSGAWVTPPSDRLLLAAIGHREGERPSLITSQKAIYQYEAIDALRYVDKSAHYYNIKGMNDFAEVRLGVVIGSPDPGEPRVQRWAALAGKSVESNGEKGRSRSYGEFGDRLLHGMRENEVLQRASQKG